MFATNNRSLALDLFKAPVGYQFDYAIVTTFSLSLEAVCSIPVAIHLGKDVQTGKEDSESEDMETLHHLSFIDALQSVEDKLLIFYQSEMVSVPHSHSKIFGLLEQYLVPVNTSKGVFHPKVWIVRFRSSSGAFFIRVGVFSRNLTLDASWDLSLVLEGVVSDTTQPDNAGLLSLVRWLQAQLSISERHSAQLDSLISDLTQTRFVIPNGFDSLSFRFFDSMSSPSEPFERYGDRFDRTLAISPFVEHRRLQKWMSMSSETTVVARQSQLDQVCLQDPGFYTTEYLANRFFVPKPADEFCEIDQNGEVVKELPDGPKGLHAKLFVLQRGAEQIVLMGSSNLTDAGWNHGNVEMMVELRTKMDGSIIDSLWPIQDDKSSFRHLCMSFYHNANPDPDLSRFHTAMRKAVKQTRPTVSWNSDRKVMSVQLENPLQTEISVGTETVSIAVTIRPLSLEKNSEQSLLTQNEFGAVLTEITSFFVFTVKPTIPGTSQSEAKESFVLQLPTRNFPEDRRQKLFEELLFIKPKTFFDFLRQLIGSTSAVGNGRDIHHDLGEGSRQGELHQILAMEDIFESLMMLMAREPQSLIKLDDALRGESFEKCKDNAEFNDFLELWKAFAPCLQQFRDGIQ